MPLMFGVFGIFFPAGLVVYWTTSNAWQIGQQYFMLKNRPTAETLAAQGRHVKKSSEPKKGFMASMMEKAESERETPWRVAGSPSAAARKPGSSKPGHPIDPEEAPRRHRWRRSEEAPQALRRPSRPPSPSSASPSKTSLITRPRTEVGDPRDRVAGRRGPRPRSARRARRAPRRTSRSKARSVRTSWTGCSSRMGIAATVDPAFEDGTMYVDVLGEGPR